MLSSCGVQEEPVISEPQSEPEISESSESEPEEQQKEVSEMFALLGRKKPEEIPYYLAWCDVAFLSFADNPLYSMTIPAKLQSYLACGIPILASACGETTRMI